MSLSDPYLLISGLLIGLIGMALLMYGKKSLEPKCICVGLAMCIYPYFVGSLLLLWTIAGLCLAAVYFLPRSG